MKQENLQLMYGSTPESFKYRVAFALKKTEEEPMKKVFNMRTVLIAMLIIVGLMAVAYAAFSSQVTALFGRMYGDETGSWLEKGDVAQADKTHTIYGVDFTLEEVVYRNNGLYGVGTIRVQEGSNNVIMPMDYTGKEAYGYDVFGEGGISEKAPADAKSIADVAREKGGEMLVVRTNPDDVGVDGGELLSLPAVGFGTIPQRDGSMRFFFEASDAYAVSKGDVYTIKMFGMVIDGAGTYHKDEWLVDIAPTPIESEETAVADENAEIAPVESDDVQIIAPAEYEQTGTLPVYRATERDFAEKVQPEWFNQSGIESRSDWQVVFKDEARLEAWQDSIYYGEYSGTFDANSDVTYADGTKPTEPAMIPRPAISGQIVNLVPSRRDRARHEILNTELEHITLEAAKATLEALLQKLNVAGYVCDYALDMSMERICTLNRERLELIASGEYSTNNPQLDDSLLTKEDEGFWLSYHKPEDGAAGSKSADFSVYAYVTKNGVAYLNLSDMYIKGEIVATPEKLVAPETVMAQLPKEMAASRFPEKLVSISEARLTYTPMRAADKADGMVLSPIWLIIYKDEQAAAQDYDCWAEFDAISGKIMNAMFK